MSKTLNTFAFFNEIAKIPRESGNEEKIAEYLVDFAKKRQLFYRRDKYNNVLIKKKTGNKKPIILQAHVDMVCEKEGKKAFDFATEPIEVIENEGYLMANGTTLGADNGIGVAQILALLDSDIKCNIEAVFTVSEETTMIGAMNFDTSDLEGKALLSFDGFEENIILMESACFYDIVLEMQHTFQEPELTNMYEITLTGMLGGHSGFDIDKKHGNSNIELAKILTEIEDIEIVDFYGGDKFNVIPSEASAKFYTKLSCNEIDKLCRVMQDELRKYYSKVLISFSAVKNQKYVLNNEQSKEFLKTIIQFPHGVIHKNENQEITTSVNLGSVNLLSGKLKVGMRSSKNVEEQECVEMLKIYSRNNNLKFNILGSQPGFESDKNCELIQNLIKTHPSDLFGQAPVLKSVHITLETGIFQSKIPNLQIALISPNILGAHTVNERVEIESVKRTDKWLVNFFES